MNRNGDSKPCLHSTAPSSAASRASEPCRSEAAEAPAWSALLRDEGGQAMVEWVIISGLMVAVLAATFAVFPTILSGFYTQGAVLLCLPIF